MEQSENLENLVSIVTATANHSLSHFSQLYLKDSSCWITYIAATASCSKYRIKTRRAVGVELDVEEGFFLLSISHVFSNVVLSNMSVFGCFVELLPEVIRMFPVVHPLTSNPKTRFRISRAFTTSAVPMNSDLLLATRETCREPPLCSYVWKFVRRGHGPPVMWSIWIQELIDRIVCEVRIGGDGVIAVHPQTFILMSNARSKETEHFRVA